MLVLGVDPGLNATGYGLITFQAGRFQLVEGGVIRSRQADPMERRVGDIFSGILEIIDEFHPDIMAMEEIYSHIKHPKTAVIMAQARGAILAAASLREVPVRSYAATMIKMSLTGNGRAAKDQVQRMVFSLLELSAPEKPYDTYDALAAALCHINQNLKTVMM